MLFRSRGDSDFVIIARTDAREALNGGKEDAIERCKLFRQAGADVIMPYATSAPSFEESREMYETIQAPLLYVSTEGRPGYAKLSKDQIEQAGFKIVIYNLIGTFSAARAVYEAMKNLKETGDSGWSHEEMNPTRKMIESLIGLPELYEIEKLYRQV